MEKEELLIQQYEEVRASGEANMFDVHSVKKAAFKIGHTELAEVAKNDIASYTYLINNYNRLMKKYNIQRLVKAVVKK